MTDRGLLAIAEAIFALAEALQPKVKAKKGPTVRTQAPDDLSNEDKHELKRWCQENEPWAVPHLRAIVDDMLQWHRAEAKPRASWLITAQRWVKAQRTKYRQDRKEAPRRESIIDAGRRIDAALRGEVAEHDADQAFFDVSAGEASGPAEDAGDLQPGAARRPSSGPVARTGGDYEKAGVLLAYRRRNSG